MGTFFKQEVLTFFIYGLTWFIMIEDFGTKTGVLAVVALLLLTATICMKFYVFYKTNGTGEIDNG